MQKSYRLQHYFCGPIRRITPDLFTFFTFGSVYCTLLIVGAAMLSRVTGGGIAYTLLAVLLGIPMLVFGLGNLLYDEKVAIETNSAVAQHLIAILTEHGALPFGMLLQTYNKANSRRITSDRLETILNASPTREFFARKNVGSSSAMGGLSITVNGVSINPQNGQALTTADIIALANANPDLLDFAEPADGDYIKGYYRLQARLKAIREHPELLTVQDSLIDDLYGLG